MTQTIFGIVAIVCAALLAYTMTPIVRVLAFKIGAVDVPLDNRRMHTKPIPRIGGLAIYLSFLITTLLFCNIDKQLVTIWIGGAVLVILGTIDDIYRLNAWLKLVIQLAAAGFAVWNGCVIDHINLGGAYVHLGYLSIPLTVLWIAGLTNAINFIDGLDGLACGVSAISSLSLMIVVLLNGDIVSTVIFGILFLSRIFAVQLQSRSNLHGGHRRTVLRLFACCYVGQRSVQASRGAFIHRAAYSVCDTDIRRVLRHCKKTYRRKEPVFSRPRTSPSQTYRHGLHSKGIS